jgi:hypothetical protein
MAAHFDPAAAGAQIEELVRKLEALDDRHGRAQAQELVRLMMSLYGAAMARMMDIVRTEGQAGSAVLDRFGQDGLIASLLVLHDLHPHSVETRVTRALDGLRPHLPASMRLSVVGITEETVSLRVDPPAGRSGAAGLRASIERAVQESAPEISEILIDGLDERQPLIQIRRGADVVAAHERS